MIKSWKDWAAVIDTRRVALATPHEIIKELREWGQHLTAVPPEMLMRRAADIIEHYERMLLMTPEGRIKELIKRVLEKHKAYVFMPVPTGFQSRSVDYFACVKGRFIAIEAKAPGKVPTSRQDYVLGLIKDAGGLTFVCDSKASVDKLDEALEKLA